MDPLGAVALVLAATGAVGAALSLGGSVNMRLDVATHALPVWLPCGLSAVALDILSGTPGDQPSLGLGMFASLVGLGLSAPELVARIRLRRAYAAGQTLKLIQFNVWDRNRDAAATARWIADQDADIVVVEEAENRGAGVLEALRSNYPYATPGPGEEPCATSILSKSEPRAGGIITSPGLEARHAGAWASFGDGAEAFTVAGTHYRWPVPASPQREQALLFAAFLNRFDRAGLIVAGDFNLTPWSFNLRRQDARLGLKRRTRALATWPVGAISHWRLTFPFPFLPIDHVYAGADWRTVSVTRGPRLGSDHLPVVAVLTRRVRL